MKSVVLRAKRTLNTPYPITEFCRVVQWSKETLETMNLRWQNEFISREGFGVCGSRFGDHTGTRFERGTG